MILWGGLSCCLSASALYLLGRSSDRDAEFLKSTWVDQLKGLAQLLDAKISPSVVTISGKVCSETPINCKLSGLSGVIVEETAACHFLKRNGILGMGSWKKDSALLLSTSEEVPWYLDDGTACVHVAGARDAVGFALTVESEAFEESERSLVGWTLDYLRGLKMLGVKRIERVLPVGTSLNVIGEAVKDDIGTIHIQRPPEGPFCVSPDSKMIDQLIANLKKWARWYKYASAGLALFGAFLIAKHAIQCILERRHHCELQKRDLAAAAKRGLNGKGKKADSLADSNQKDHLSNLCDICFEQDCNAVFVPCGHLCCCTACSSRLTRCPLCRGGIEQVVKTFRH